MIFFYQQSKISCKTIPLFFFVCVFFSDAETQYATMSGMVLCGNGITGNIKT